jgi:hypothetical protein
VTTNSVLQAALYAMTTITSVAALGLALFGSGAFLERWLDGDILDSTPLRPETSLPRVDPAPAKQDAQTQVA